MQTGACLTWKGAGGCRGVWQIVIQRLLLQHKHTALLMPHEPPTWKSAGGCRSQKWIVLNHYSFDTLYWHETMKTALSCLKLAEPLARSTPGTPASTTIVAQPSIVVVVEGVVAISRRIPAISLTVLVIPAEMFLTASSSEIFITA